MPLVIWRVGVDEDLQRQGGDGLVEPDAPELIAERGEEQRGGFSSDAGEGEHAAGDDARRGCSEANGEDGSPLGNAQTEGGFANGMRHGGEHLFGGASDGRDHHDGERDASGKRGEMFLGHHDERVDRDAHDDRGDAVEDVCREAYSVGEECALTELCDVDAGGDADGDAHEAGEGEDDSRADDGVGHAAALFTNRSRDVGEEVQVEGTRAFVDQVEENGEQRYKDHDGGEDRQTGDEVVDHSAAGAVEPHSSGLEVHRRAGLVEGLGAHA